MKLLQSVLVFSFSLFVITKVKSQETLPIFADYLSDNVYLLHPAAAGVGNCSKLRLTAGSYWGDNELQTASFHSGLGEYSKTALGAIAFNDKNGYHSEKGFQATYAYHIEFFRSNVFNQLSFGLSLGAVQNQVDQRTFEGDPIVRQAIESDFYFNGDFGLAYHYGGLSSYFTIKNLFLSVKPNASVNYESLNLKNYILSGSYFFGDKEKLQYEPSIMVQYKPGTNDTKIDFNIKVYKQLENTQLWAAFSYRSDLNNNPVQQLQQFTPIIGANIGRWMVSYTYSKQTGNVLFRGNGFHQISLGVNLFCRKPRASACPNINGSF